MSNAPCVSSEYFTDSCSSRNNSSLIFTGCLPPSRLTSEISVSSFHVLIRRSIRRMSSKTDVMPACPFAASSLHNSTAQRVPMMASSRVIHSARAAAGSNTSTQQSRNPLLHMRSNGLSDVGMAEIMRHGTGNTACILRRVGLNSRHSHERFATMKKLLITLTVLAGFSSQAALASAREEARLIEASGVLEELFAQKDTAIPEKLMARAYGIAVIPNVVKVAAVVGGRRSSGAMVVRDANGKFTDPIMVSLTGGNVGWQIGVQSTDIVLVFTTARSIQGITDGKLTLGADAAVAAPRVS